MSFPLPVQADYSLRAHNTFGIDVRALAYLRVFAADTLRAVMRDPILAALPRLVLGGGSNLVFVRDFPGLVLHMCNRGMTIVDEDADATYVRAAAGENWHQFVQWTLAEGLPGLENLSLIPGTVGAAPIQNIGAYGVEINSLLHAVDVLDLASGEVSTMDGAACEFAYRDSVFKHRLRDRVVITEVTFRLPKKWQPNIAYADVAQELAAKNITQPTALQISEAVIAIRSRKLPDPAHIGNAGSFFKNPVVTAEQRNALLARFPQLVSHLQPGGSFKLAAGWMIDQCGWKGKRLGLAGVYEKQALVLVNHGGAAGEEVATLAHRIQQDVRERFGVSLEPEPTFV